MPLTPPAAPLRRVQLAVRCVTMLSLLLPGHLPAQATARVPLTIARMTSGRSLTGIAPAAPAWSPTSQQLAFLWNDRGQPQRTLWLVDRDGAQPRRLLADTLTAAISEYVWARDGRSLLYVQGGDVHRVPADGGVPMRLTVDGGDKSDLALSPDGTRLAYLSDGDLYLLTPGQPAERLTRLAVAPIGSVPLGTYFRRDVEIGSATWGGDAPSLAWAPDGRTIAVHFVDRRGVPVLEMPLYAKGRATLNRVRRSAPGEANEVRKVGLVDVSTRQLRFIELPDSSSTRVVNVAWSRDGALLIDRATDDEIDRTIHVVAPGSTTPRRIWNDHRESRIYNDIASAWTADGRQVLISGDLDDRYRLYLLTPGDSTPRPISPATSDVTGAAHDNAATGRILYLSNDPLPSERHVWTVRADGSRRERITQRAGTHTAFPSPDGRTLALLSTDDVTPTELWLQALAAGATARRITRSPSPDFAGIAWVTPQYVTLPARAGLPPLALRILMPPVLDSTRRYPVLFGPVYSNTVRNRWQGLYATLQQYLAIEKGYIVVQVDVRGSTGYGRDYREKFLMDWGGSDLDDLEAAVRHLQSMPFVDPARIGIWGSSYGGTLTVYSLLRKPGLFAAGVAGAPATDPFFFGSDDVAIARRPQTNPETFGRGALQYAGNLRDHLLIIHGMQDDVVPFATSVALMDEFMRLGKDVDFAFAPAATHGWTQRPAYARALLTRLVEHFDRYLGAGPR